MFRIELKKIVKMSSANPEDPTDNFEGRFNEEWFWVLGYGSTSVIVIVANTLMLCSIAKNAFLYTNTHRSLALLATRHILRAMYGLSVVYVSRWSHPYGKWRPDVTQVDATKVCYYCSFSPPAAEYALAGICQLDSLTVQYWLRASWKRVDCSWSHH